LKRIFSFKKKLELKMQYFVAILSLLVLMQISSVEAQTLKKRSSFISGLVGAAQVSNSGSSNRAGSVALTFGGSFGFPITKNLYIYTRGSYSSKSNFQSYYNTSYLTTQFQLSDQFVEVNSSFNQLLLNAGLLYTFELYKDLTLGVSGGVSFAVINQEAQLIGGHVISSIDNEAIWGYFGGLMIEKGWEETNVTTFAEAQYNYAQSDAPYHASALNAVNITFGVRYYMNRRGFN
jgi:hypothetical protein